MSKYLVLNVQRYDFTREGGDRFQGVRVTYLDQQAESSDKVRGLVPMTVGGPVELWERIEKVPGHYALDFKQRPDFKGRPTLSLTDAVLISEASPVA